MPPTTKSRFLIPFGKKCQSVKKIFDLSLVIAKTEFKLKNEGKILGVFWHLLAPIVTFFSLWGIFQNRLGQEITHYPLYLFLGIIVFGYFQKISDEAVVSIKNNPVIKSVNFPLESLIGSIVIKTLFIHFFEVLVLFGLMLIFNIPIVGLIFYPLILILLSLFSFGCGLTLSAIGAYFFDMEHIWGFGSKIVWFATPIFYTVTEHTKLAEINQWNPLYYFITLTRDLVIYNKNPELAIWIGALLSTIIAVTVGSIIFGRLKAKFAELI